ncbi:MAG: AmmeMemoRadiSam system protein B, partial [Deltaproteobacteria bacterium]|nr:AmmeMemoRadiSam system protein B [Deltaproteobacteria bacterium]
PVRADSFYPADPSQLSQMIDQLTRKAQKTGIQIPPNKHLRAIIMPHAGYIYSGWTAAHASLVIKSGHFSKVILLGPDHFVGFSNAAISDATDFETPLGKIKLHKDVAKLRRQSNLFHPLPLAYDKEHSLEVLLPFLQTYLGDFQLLPILVGQAEIKGLSSVLEAFVDQDTLMVVSSDLSHYLSYAEAVNQDQETINRILNLKTDELVRADNWACGARPILILLNLARRHQWQPELLHYCNSGDTAGDRSRVVGYAAIAFWGELSMQNTHDSSAHFSEEQGQILVKLARKTIMEKLGRQSSASESNALAQALQDDKFQSSCGTFVTLKIQGQLRGCIGNLTSTDSILDSIRLNAINAAFHDPRFSPLSDDELDQTEIEVSILTEPLPMEYRDGQDLMKRLKVDVDGVMIRKGSSSATFLPQVWEQLPRPEDFLGHLCMKAGLSSDAWKGSELEILTYQVQYFEEKK